MIADKLQRDALMLKIASFVSIVLLSIHLADDIVRRFEPGTLSNLTAVPIMAVWLCATLLFNERLAGRIIMLLGGLLAAGVPYLHMRGAGVGGAFARSDGAIVFIWTLFAMGVSGTFSVVLIVRAMWAQRRSRPANGMHGDT